MSLGLDLDTLDQVSRATAVVRRGTVKISAHLDAARPSLNLTQSRIMQLTAQGLTDETIARHLRCSVAAVRLHLDEVYTRLDLTTDADPRVSAVLWWVTR